MLMLRLTSNFHRTKSTIVSDNESFFTEEKFICQRLRNNSENCRCRVVPVVPVSKTILSRLFLSVWNTFMTGKTYYENSSKIHLTRHRDEKIIICRYFRIQFYSFRMNVCFLFIKFMNTWH